ncbi:MAG: hypothetical protein ABI604_20425, partial [Nitrospirota bacterium]
HALFRRCGPVRPSTVPAGEQYSGAALPGMRAHDRGQGGLHVGRAHQGFNHTAPSEAREECVVHQIATRFHFCYPVSKRNRQETASMRTQTVAETYTPDAQAAVFDRV